MAPIRRTINTEVRSIAPTIVVDGFELKVELKRVRRAAGVALAALAAAGCMLAQSSGEQTETRSAAVGQEPANSAPAADLPEVDLDGELLYQVLVGEIAVRQGDSQAAANALLEAARLSRDPRLAQRATRVALDGDLLDLATDAASLWVTLQPEDDAPAESLALIMVEQGRIEDGAAQFARLLGGNNEQQGAALRRIARLLGQLSNRANALAAMKNLVARYEDDADAHFAAAYLADRVDEDELVLESLDRALALRPGWEEAALAKLGHLIQNQYPKERVDGFSREFFEPYPEATRVRISYARYLVDENEAAAALEHFQAVLEYEPENTTGLMAAGLLNVQEQNYKTARELFVRHLEVTPDNDQVRLYLGQVAEERERYEEAENWYSEISDQEYLFSARLHLATMVYDRGGAESALEHLEKLEPADESEFVQLALTKERVLREADELSRAKSVLDDAVSRYPANSDLLYARGLLSAQLDEIGEHEKDMRALLAENPNNAHALNALGYTLADATDRIDEAHDLVSKALSMRPDDPFILDSMGWVQYRLGNHQDAIQYLEKALSLREDAEIAAHLGEVLWVTGNKERAREVWTRARQEHPDNHVLNETIERFTP